MQTGPRNNNMKYTYTNFFSNATFILTDIDSKSFEQRMGGDNFFKIIWAKDNDLEIMIDGYSYIIQQDHLLFCTPFNIIEVGPDTKGGVAYIFNKEFYCIQDHDKEVSCNGVLFYGSSVPPMVGLMQDEMNRFVLLYRFFVEEFQIEDHVQEEMLRVLLKRLLIMATRITTAELFNPNIMVGDLDIVRQYNLLVEQHFRKKHTVAHYAELLKVTPKYLATIFHKYNNKTPLKIIQERVILEAKRLLMYSDHSSAAISDILNFKEPAHFYKFFKKHTELTPKEYKKEQ